MTGLLVSVRSAAEAIIALQGGADVIDVKEPRNGALGAADGSVWGDVLKAVNGRVPTSAALGELVGDLPAARASKASGFQFVKAGLAHWNAEAEQQWLSTCQALPQGVSLIPAVYANAQTAGWQSLGAAIDAALRLAATARSPLILIDTFDKS